MAYQSKWTTSAAKMLFASPDRDFINMSFKKFCENPSSHYWQIESLKNVFSVVFGSYKITFEKRNKALTVIRLEGINS